MTKNKNLFFQNMFGKNKKNNEDETIESSDQPAIHTMQDDLDLGESLSDKAGGDVIDIGASDQKEKEYTKKETLPASGINSVGKESPFLGNPLPKSETQDENPEEEALGFASEENLEEKGDRKGGSSSEMPKSVDNLTTAVGKDDSSGKNFLGTSRNIHPEKNMDEGTGEDMILEDIDGGGKSKAFLFLAGFFIIAAGVVGYFIWSSGYNVGDLVSSENISQLNIFTDEPKIVIEGGDESIEEESFIEESVFSEGVNFLTINSANMNAEGLTGIFNQKFVEMESANSGLVEFMAVDESNNPIRFSDFSSAFGIIFPPNIANILSDDFSIFLYREGDLRSAGLAISTSNPVLLKSSLKMEESNLVKDLSPLFMGKVSEDVMYGNLFNDSLYGYIDVRYTNIDTENSIDYAILDDSVVFATSKNSGRSIMDKISIENAGYTDNLENIEAVEGVETVLDESETMDIFSEIRSEDSAKSGETVIDIE
ncbi:MAG: hypothetical protein RBS86_01885 [Candidatus Moranbacteria bacterium]|nr:hypothetical protein [Candidatus Moranbacteria bacterium]